MGSNSALAIRANPVWPFQTTHSSYLSPSTSAPPRLPQHCPNWVFFSSLLTIWNKSKQVNQNPRFTSIPWETLEWWHVLPCLPVWAAACWHTTTVYKTPTSFLLSFLPLSSFLIPDYGLTISREFKWHKPICHANGCCPLPCQQVLKKEKKIWYKNATTKSW